MKRIHTFAVTPKRRVVECLVCLVGNVPKVIVNRLLEVQHWTVQETLIPPEALSLWELVSRVWEHPGSVRVCEKASVNG